MKRNFVALKLTDLDVERIDFIAKKQGSSRSAVIRMAVYHLLEVFEARGVFTAPTSTQSLLEMSTIAHLPKPDFSQKSQSHE